MNKLIAIILFLFAGSQFLNAQEVVIGIGGNNAIQQFLKNSPELKNSEKIMGDTLKLPFFDDFSKGKIFPDADLWSDDNVFINNNYASNPPTIGAATFDAINSYGAMYSNASRSGFKADYLTSLPIYLSNYTGYNIYQIADLFMREDTNFVPAADSIFFKVNDSVFILYADTLSEYSFGDTIYKYNWTDTSYHLMYDTLFWYSETDTAYQPVTILVDRLYSAEDSLYLSFFYQPKGAGFAPEPEDSLVLEFWSPSEAIWYKQWSVAGSTSTEFRQVLVPVKDSIFLQDGFRFRFYNYASLAEDNVPSFAGNNDVWNIDYVYLNAFRSEMDTSISDVAIIDPLKSLLRDYQSMPWSHFIYNNSQARNTFKARFKNYYADSVIHYDRFYDLVNLEGNKFYMSRNLGAEDIYSFDIDTLGGVNIPNLLENNFSADSTVFHLKAYLNMQYEYMPDYKKWNDTIAIDQYFHDFYAYDDGSAEAGYGLAGGGSENAMVAYRFSNFKPDTLKAVDFYFNQVYEGANKKYFYLTFWKDNNGEPGEIIYQQESSPVDYGEDLNSFVRYAIEIPDTAETSQYIIEYLGERRLVIPDTSFFVGWQKIVTDAMLNVGLDVNNDKSDRIFYTYSGEWKSSSVTGSLMLRPVFGSTPVKKKLSVQETGAFNVYPNPVRNILYVQQFADLKYNAEVMLFDMTGKMVYYSPVVVDYIDTSNLTEGIYLLKITDYYSVNYNRKLEKVD